MKPTYSIRTVVFAAIALALLAGIVTRQAAAQARIDLDVKRAVVRIVPERCFGGTSCRPQNDQPGSGVIVHPSGLILTAWHVLSADKDFQQENYWDDFVIEMIDEDDGVPPVPRYRARIVATRPDMDLALLRIDRDSNGQAVTDEALAALPWLAVYEGLSNQLESGNTQLHILGYPKPPLPTDPTTLSTNQNLSLNRRNRPAAELEVQLPFDKGYSGGPALTQREGALQVTGIVLASVGNRTKLRDLSVAFREFDWVAAQQQVYADNIFVTQTAANGMPFIQFDADVQALGLENVPLQFQISFFEANSHLPWQPAVVDLPQFDNRQVYWLENLRPDRPVYHRTLRVLIPMGGVDIPPDQLAFRLKLAREDDSVQLWSDNRWYQAQPGAVAPSDPPATTSTRTPTHTPTRRLPTSTHTATQQVTATPTNSPSPTREPLTNTLTPTPTYTRILLPPTSTPTQIPTPTPLPVYEPYVIIDSHRYEVSATGTIEFNAQAQTLLRIEIVLQDPIGNNLSPGLATYQWTFAPADPENAERVGTGNNVLNYTVPSDRRAQLVIVVVETAGFRKEVHIRILIG